MNTKIATQIKLEHILTNLNAILAECKEQGISSIQITINRSILSLSTESELAIKSINYGKDLLNNKDIKE